MSLPPRPPLGLTTARFTGFGDPRSQARRVALVTLCALALLLAGAVRAQAASGPATSAINGWSLYGLSPDALDGQLAQIQSEGVTQLRADASWSALQPQPPTAAGPGYRWGGEDAEVAALARHGMRWAPIVDYSAPWAAQVPGDWRSPPANDSQYAAFAAAIASRYGPGGSFWAQNPQLPYEPVQTFEIWNEENANYYWDTGPSPAAYGQLYAAARSAIHAVDPSATVMVGGLTNPRSGISALQFLQEMFALDPTLVGNVDAVGLHPYAANAQGVVSDVTNIRALLDTNEESWAPIDITEFGWQAGTTAAAEQWRATEMSSLAQELANSNCGIGSIAPYDWMDPSYITTGDWGLAGPGGLRPAGTAWFNGLAAADRAPQTTPCQPSPLSGAAATASAPAAATPAAAATHFSTAAAATPAARPAPVTAGGSRAARARSTAKAKAKAARARIASRGTSGRRTSKRSRRASRSRHRRTSHTRR